MILKSNLIYKTALLIRSKNYIFIHESQQLLKLQGENKNLKFFFIK